MTKRSGGSASLVRASVTSFEILEQLREMDGAGLSELATTLDTSKSTVHRHLTTLQELEYVVRSGDEFHLSHSFLRLAESARRREPSYELVREKVAELAYTTDERAQFVVAEFGRGVCLFRASGDQAVDTSPKVGSRMPIHATAAGKSLLAFDDDLSVKDLAEQDRLPLVTDHTITDPDDLRREIESVRDQGYAVNREEQINGLTAFGAPIRRRDGTVLGAISISGPADRFAAEDTETRVLNHLLGTTNEIELNIAPPIENGTQSDLL